MKRYTFDTVLKDYPWVATIFGHGIPKYELHVVTSPTANCQTFFINYAKRILDIQDEDMLGFVSDLSRYASGKRQCIIDVNEEFSDQIIAKFTPFLENKITTPYVSTNGSNMVLHILQFDRDKLLYRDKLL